jgi:hypothetical protein
MRHVTIVGFLISFGVACSNEGEQDGVADGASESGDTDEEPTIECETRATQAACVGLGDSNWQKCSWVDVWTYTGTTCEVAATEGACVTLSYQGNGCQVAYACGASEGPNAYFRTGEAGVQVFQLEACEHQPDPEWQQCSWEGTDVTPDPACACAC